MSENTAVKGNDTKPSQAPATPVVEEEKVLTAEEKKKIFDSIPPMFQKTISDVNKEISAHNANVDRITQAEKTDTNLIKSEIFEQSENPAIKRLYSEYVKLLDQVEKLKDQAYEQIDKLKLMPGEITPEELEKLKAEVTAQHKILKDKVAAFVQFEEMMPEVKGKLTVLTDDIKTRRGTGKATSSSDSQTGTKRLRFKRITVNDVTQDEKGNTVYGILDGNEKYTFSFLSAYLKKQHKGIKWVANDLTAAYMESVSDKDNLPDTHTFEMPFTYKDGNGNDVTVVYKIKTER